MSKGNKYWRNQIGRKCFINNKKKQNFPLGSYMFAKKYKIPKKLIIMEGSLEEKIYKLKE